MISEAVESQIKLLLDGGCHYKREIARMTGVCVDTVRRVASGKVLKRRRGAVHRRKAPVIVPPDRRKKPEVCPTCRRRVQMPCQRCQLAALGKTMGTNDRAMKPLGLDLQEPHAKRYREIIRQRRLAVTPYVPPEEEVEEEW